jgi:hypothetical protein
MFFAKLLVCVCVLFNDNLITVTVLADVEDGGAPSVVSVGRASAELLPQEELVKFKEAVSHATRVGEGGMTFNFPVG